MKRVFGLLLIGMLGMACSESGSTGSLDLAAAPDLAVTEVPDQAAGMDQALPAEQVLSLVAGGLGGLGSADGSGSAVRFNSPNKMVVDSAGTLYVADTRNSTIRKVVLATGMVTTLAGSAGMPGNTDGTGAAVRFRNPEGLALDGTGSLYVADTMNSTIRRVELATGVVTTLAGSAGTSGSTDGIGAAARFDNPNDVAADGAGNLYVADSANHTLRKVVLATSVVTTLAGSAGMSGSANGTGATARFDRPNGLALDGVGSLYVSDSFNHTIRKVALATAAVTTLAGSAGVPGGADGLGGAARFRNSEGLTLDGAGSLYVADSGNHTIRKVLLATGAVTTLAGSAGLFDSIDGTGAAARFFNPNGLALDGTGNVYVADSGNHTIRKVVSATGVVTTAMGASSKNGITNGTGAAARFSNPSSVVPDGVGNLYVADSGSSTIRKVVVATGVVTTLAGTAGLTGSTDASGTAARFNNPSGLALDGAGTLYVADANNHTIRKVVVATGLVSTLAGSALMVGSTDAAGTAARFNHPAKLALDGTGNLYVADSDNHTIRKVVVATGLVSTLAGSALLAGSDDSTGAAARFKNPEGLALDTAGILYVADYGNSTIRKLDVVTRVVTTLAGAAGMPGAADGAGPAARFDSPNGLSLDGLGNLYVSDPNGSTIRKIQLSNSLVTTRVGRSGPRGVKLGPLPAGLNRPRDACAFPSGELYILDENSLLTVR